MIRKNDRLTVKIEDYTSEGFGLARWDGFVLFVPGGVLGDTLEVHVLKVLKTKGYAKIVRVISPSPARTDCGCAQNGRCGGCVFWQMDYAEELRLKAERIRQNLIRLGGIPEPCMLPPVGAPSLFGYRNKAQYPVRPVGKTAAAGFFAPHSHRLISVDKCQIEPPIFTEIVRFTLQFMQTHRLPAYDERTHTGLVRHIYLRRGTDVMVCVVINGQSFPKQYAQALKAHFEQVKCVCFNINTARTNAVLGEKTVFLTEQTGITDTLLGNTFTINPHAFYQVNHAQTERLYAEVKRLANIQPEDTVLDLYCGIGTIGICVAGRAKRLVGIEIVPQAVENARQNARQNGLQNAEYYCADAKDGAQMLTQKGITFQTVIVDPPRKGCDKQTLDAIERLAPQKLIYVSCDPATLARDISRLSGYRLVSATPVDMFPRTAHVETVALLQRAQTN